MMNEISEINYETVGRFAAIPHSFIEHAKDLSLHARWLFVAMMYYRNSKSGRIYPSYTAIRKLTGLRREKIAESIEELEKANWLKKIPRGGTSSEYKLLFPPPVPEGPDMVSESTFAVTCEADEKVDMDEEPDEDFWNTPLIVVRDPELLRLQEQLQRSIAPVPQSEPE